MGFNWQKERPLESFDVRHVVETIRVRTIDLCLKVLKSYRKVTFFIKWQFPFRYGINVHYS